MKINRKKLFKILCAIRNILVIIAMVAVFGFLHLFFYMMFMYT